MPIGHLPVQTSSFGMLSSYSGNVISKDSSAAFDDNMQLVPVCPYLTNLKAMYGRHGRIWPRASYDLPDRFEVILL